ncbi:MAG: septal ring lytic transglycosylase RlpA family protein [Pseudomonadota bacterium]
MKTNVSRSLSVALSSVSCVAMIFAGQAHADRNPAPIVYATPGQTSAQATPSSAAQPITMAEAPKLTKQTRVEFRYPSGVEAGASPLGAAPAMATPAAAPVYAATRAAPSIAPTTAPMQFNVPSVAAPSAAPIRIASVDTQIPARAGKPLTLSRVRADKDAAIEQERGPASVYADGFNGQPTANGEIFDETAMTAAHPSLPLPSLVQVINEANSREVVVRVNDRGPFDGKRVLELSPRAGEVLGISKGATSNVSIRYLGPAPVKHNADQFASIAVAEEALPPVAPAPVPLAPMRVVSAGQGVAAYEAPVRIANLSVAAPVAVGNVFIQAGAFADISNAQRLTTSLRADLPVKIEEARVNGGDYFRVLIGPFPSMEDASVERDYLARAIGVEGFLTKR